MNKKDKARELYDALTKQYGSLENWPSFEELYDMACSELEFSMGLYNKERLMKIDKDVPPVVSEDRGNLDSDKINKEDFMLRFLLGAVLVIGLGYGAYRLIKSRKEPEQPNKYGQPPYNPTSVHETPRPQPQPPVSNYLLLAVESSKLNGLYPDFAMKDWISVEDGAKFYKLPWFLLADQNSETVNSIKNKWKNTNTSEYAILAVKLAATEMRKLRKESPLADKRDTVENFTGKSVAVLGTAEFNELNMPFYGIG
jgi:predicted transcriptional regulator